MAKPSWITIADSIRGDSHVRKGMPNQDSIAHFLYPGKTPATILAVSDGHGSDKCPRSDTGSRLAVTAAIDELTKFWELEATWFDPSASEIETTRLEDSERLNKLERWMRKELPELIAENWECRVKRHNKRNPLPDDGNPQDIFLAYGATLSIAFVTQTFAACLQLGDCEFLVVDHAGEAQALFASAHGHIGEETDSLCMPDRNERWRFWINRFNEGEASCPQLILVCSDGYEKSFERPNGFLLAGTHFAERLATNHGEEEIRSSLKDWMRQSSNYSGDDVSIGILFSGTTCRSENRNTPNGEVITPADSPAIPPRVGELGTSKTLTNATNSEAHAQHFETPPALTEHRENERRIPPTDPPEPGEDTASSQQHDP